MIDPTLTTAVQKLKTLGLSAVDIQYQLRLQGTPVTWIELKLMYNIGDKKK